MRVTERYNQKNNEKSKEKNRKNDEDLYADFYEAESKKKRMSALNTDKGVMQESIYEGINSEKSIFDKTAVFRTE